MCSPIKQSIHNPEGVLSQLAGGVSLPNSDSGIQSPNGATVIPCILSSLRGLGHWQTCSPEAHASGCLTVVPAGDYRIFPLYTESDTIWLLLMFRCARPEIPSGFLCPRPHCATGGIFNRSVWVPGWSVVFHPPQSHTVTYIIQSSPQSRSTPFYNTTPPIIFSQFEGLSTFMIFYF